MAPVPAGVRSRGGATTAPLGGVWSAAKGFSGEPLAGADRWAVPEHVDERAQRDRNLPVAGIVEEEPLKGGRPVLEDTKQLPRAQKRVCHGFGRIRDSHS